ncbi:hypothetical protein BDK51DRAFT_46434 [Blyttiomyces helicus]|uniref:Uncharacterized protein n=1 Tax=Blyttiomyces helicus TaxID=388810 RepID=A0A4P9WKI1_9FUNG|nr:hypothetical protein BDK51DRAFT_46434 [Blyttiomyces helicus]|eukprot:RKO91670.1 hypothetical protein BDK51DRAFT_46434 [Blyttiomyces helicus]
MSLRTPAPWCCKRRPSSTKHKGDEPGGEDERHAKKDPATNVAKHASLKYMARMLAHGKQKEEHFPMDKDLPDAYKNSTHDTALLLELLREKRKLKEVELAIWKERNKDAFITTGWLAADAFVSTEFFNQSHPVPLDLITLAMLHIQVKKVVPPQTWPVADRQIGGEPDLCGSGSVPLLLQQVPFIFCADVAVAQDMRPSMEAELVELWVVQYEDGHEGIAGAVVAHGVGKLGSGGGQRKGRPWLLVVVAPRMFVVAAVELVFVLVVVIIAVLAVLIGAVIVGVLAVIAAVLAIPASLAAHAIPAGLALAITVTVEVPAE